MFKGGTWILLVFLFSTLLNMVLGYRSHYRDNVTPVSTQYQQTRQNVERSDDFQPEYSPEQNTRYSNNEEAYRQSQSQGGPADWSSTANVETTEDSGRFNEYYRSIPERGPYGLEQNLRPALHSPSQQNFNYRNPQQGSTPYQGTNIPDERLLFIVQRKPDGKLNVVFNESALAQNRPHLGLENRGQIPIVTPEPARGKRDIIFPGDKMGPKNRMRPQCLESGKTFCSSVENYPKAVADQILDTEAVKFEQLFGEDILPEQSLNITQRIDAPGEETLCMSKAQIVYPQAGLTKDNNWSFIINHENYKQGVRIEECVSAGKPCTMAENFPNTYTTECKQKFIFRHLVSMNDDGKVVKDLFQLPSCCICVLKSMTRFRRRAPPSLGN